MFVLPSDREGLSNSLLEAMACGLPCVAPASAAGDQVLDPSSGVVPPSNDPRDLADALARLLDPALRARLGAGARAAAQRYGLDAVTTRYELLYRDHTSRQEQGNLRAYVSASPRPAPRGAGVSAANVKLASERTSRPRHSSQPGRTEAAQKRARNCGPAHAAQA